MTAEQIVRALAAADPSHGDPRGTLRRCTFCGKTNDWPRVIENAADHDADCPWRLAVEWVAAQDAAQRSDQALYGCSFTEGGRRVDPATMEPWASWKVGDETLAQMGMRASRPPTDDEAAAFRELFAGTASAHWMPCGSSIVDGHCENCDVAVGEPCPPDRDTRP